MSASGTSNPVIGVREVWKPAEEPTVDIVAVHGLGGHAYGTWTAKKENTGLDHDVFWLRDLLPKEVPHARVLTYGYDSSPAKLLGSASTSMVHHHATDLVSELHHFRRRDNERHRPIVFVVHSLGGIVVKRALIYSNGGTIDHNVEYRSIKVSTYGIIFLGTPHMGADLAKWGKWTEWLVSTVTPKSLLDTSAALVGTLEKNSETLQNITEQFLGISGDFRLFFFYETMPTSIKGMTQTMIVDYSSAVVEALPNAGRFGIRATHSEMCKFIDEFAPGWNVLAGVITEFVKNAPKDAEWKWQTEFARQEQAKRQKIANALLELPEYGRSRSPSPNRLGAPGSRGQNHHGHSPDLLSRSIPQLITGNDDETSNMIPVVKPDSLQENDYFEGRENELQALDKVLRDSSKRTVCISCVTGGGKTHLARQYFFTHGRCDFPGGAFWIDCKSIQKTMSMEQLDYGYSRIAERLHLPPRLERVEGETVDPRLVTQMQVTDWFSRNDGWLLVLDGLDIENDGQLDLVSGYIPRSKGGSILITTLNSSLRDAARLRFPELLELERVDFQSARNMLFHFANIRAAAAANEREKTAAGDLVQALGFLPLAIHSAGSYIKARKMSVGDYLKQYRKRPFAEREFLPSMHLIFDRIETEEKYKETNNLLRILAFFDREIPVEMLLWGIRAVNEQPRFNARESGHTLFDNTIHHLLTFSLVDRTKLTDEGQRSDNGEIDTLMLHSVAQDVCISRMRDKDRKDTNNMKPNELRVWLRHAIDIYCGSFESLESRNTEDDQDFLVSDYRRFEVHGTRLIAHAQRHKIPTGRLQAVMTKIGAAINTDGNLTVNRRSMFRSGSLTESLTDTPVSTRTPSWNLMGCTSESPVDHQSMEVNGGDSKEGDDDGRSSRNGAGVENDDRVRGRMRDELARMEREHPFRFHHEHPPFRYTPPKGPKNPFARPKRASTGIEPSRPRAPPTSHVYTETAATDSFSRNSGTPVDSLQHLMQQKRMVPSVAPSRPVSRQSTSTFSSFVWGSPRPERPGTAQQQHFNPRSAAMSPVSSQYPPQQQQYQPMPGPIQQFRPHLPGRGRSGSMPSSHSAPAGFGGHLYRPFANSSSPTLPQYGSTLAPVQSPPRPLSQNHPQYPFPAQGVAYGSPPVPVPMPLAPYPVTPLDGPSEQAAFPPDMQIHHRPSPFTPGFTPDIRELANSPTARAIVGPRDRPPSECWSEPIPEHGSFSYALSSATPMGRDLSSSSIAATAARPRESPPVGSRSGSRSVSPLIFQLEANLRPGRPGTGHSSYSAYPPPPQAPSQPPLRRQPAVANFGGEAEPGRFSPPAAPPGISVHAHEIIPFAESPLQQHPQATRHMSLDDTLDGNLVPPTTKEGHPLRGVSSPDDDVDGQGNPPAPGAEDMRRSVSEPGPGEVAGPGHGHAHAQPRSATVTATGLEHVPRHGNVVGLGLMTGRLKEGAAISHLKAE